MSYTTNCITQDDLLIYKEKFCMFCWGATALFCTVKPLSGTFKYEIVSNMKKVFESNYIKDSIEEYNKLISNY
jgi:hypothetical protein